MNDGTAIELLSRGKQDAYFIQNARRTWFGAEYERRNGATRDVIIVEPISPCSFNSHVDIELPRTGDVLKSVELRITMPTWLPPEVVAINESGTLVQVACPYPIPGGSMPNPRATFGWTNGIANIIISRWQLFADNLLLMEGYGEVNNWKSIYESTQTRAPIINFIAGVHDGSNESVQRNATPSELTFHVPLPGCQMHDDAGLPLWAMQAHQRLFLRVWIPPMSKLAESGAITSEIGPPEGEPIYAVCPAPWGGNAIYIDNVISPYVTTQEYKVGAPILHARYSVLHLDEEARAGLREKPHTLLFQTQMMEMVTFDQKTLFAGYRFSKRLEIKGFFNSLCTRFLSIARSQQNKYLDTRALNESGNWVSQMGLIVNGQDRILPWRAEELFTVTINTQMPSDVIYRQYYMQFAQTRDGLPGGPLYLTRSDKVLLQFVFAAVQNDPVLPTTSLCYLNVVGLSWQIIDIKNGFCSVRYS